MKKYNNLFTPLTVRSMTMKNRIAMTPMGTNFGGEGGDFTEEHMHYYEQRAKGGTGLIIVENACVDFPLGSNGTTQIRLTEDRFIPALYELTERIHKHGACAAIQINHSGASAVPSRIGGLQPVSASNIPSKTGGAIPRPLTKEEIIEIAEKYGDAARRAQMAGFYAVEIHGGHSYLLCQFLSPVYNNRTDEFGGSIENRARFAKLVIEKVREAVGPFFPIILRVSAEEFVKGGNTLEDTLKTLEYLNDEVDIFNVSSALNDSIQFQIDAMHLEDGWRAYMAEAVKKKFNKPTITTGNIRSPKVAVIGGGAVGLDVVELFSSRGAEVSIVERLPMLGRDLDVVTKVGMLSMVKENNVNVLTDTSLLEVKENSFLIEKNGVEEELEFDYGFVCLGMRNYSPVLSELQEYYAGTDVEIVNIGDSVRARRIIDGIKEGRNIITSLNKIGALS